MCDDGGRKGESTANTGQQQVRDDRGASSLADDLMTLRSGLPFEEVQQRIGLAYALAGRKHRVVSHYLHEVARRGLHQLAGCRTASQYASMRFGMSKREARDLLAAGKALTVLRRINDAFADGKLCWSKVRELIKVATPTHEEKWIETARKLSTDELILEVRLARHGEAPRARDDRKGLPEIRLTLEISFPPDVWARWEQVRKKLSDEAGRPLAEWECQDALFELCLSVRDDGTVPGKTPASGNYCVVVREHGDGSREPGEPPVLDVETEDGPLPLSPALAEAIACDADEVDLTDPRKPSERRVPAAMRRAVLARDGYKCLACFSKYRLTEHHVIPWARGGKTEPKNLATLCRGCHPLVHANLLIMAPVSPGTWRFLDREGRDIHDQAGLLDEIRAAGGDGPTRLVLPEVMAAPVNENGTMCRARETRPPRPAPSPLRPRTFDDVIGQAEVVADLAQATRVARDHGEAIGHTLLIGGAGLGKTTLAGVVAEELGVTLDATCGTHLREPVDLLAFMSGLEARGVVFIDEIHAMTRPVAEMLYEAMEDGRLCVPVPEGGTMCHTLPPFTLIGATTEPGALPAPLLRRFEHQHWLRPYDVEALTRLIERAAGRVGVAIVQAAAAKLAAVSRGTAREALRLLRQARQQARAEGVECVDASLAARTLERLGIDELGLVPLEREYLALVAAHGPIGLHRLAAMLGVDARVLERDHEPYLFRLGLASATPSGRIALRGAAAATAA